MANTFSDVDIKRFRFQAKHLSRRSNIAYTEALDAVAHEQGFSTWALLMKHAGPVDAAAAVVPSREYFRFTRTTDEMHQAMRKVQSKEPYYHRDHEHPAERLTAQIFDKFEDGANAVTFAIEYVECLLSVPQFRIHVDSQVRAEMRYWLPYQVSQLNEATQVFVNRKYKPVGLKTAKWATYEDYPNLVISLEQTQVRAVSHIPSALGFLFADASAPWHSRQNAELYLGRLKRLREYVRGL